MLTDSMKFRQARISLADSQVVVAMELRLAEFFRKVADASNCLYNHCDRNSCGYILKELPHVISHRSRQRVRARTTRRRRLECRREPFDDWLRCPPPDGHQGSRSIREFHRHPDDPFASKVEASVDIASVTTGDDTRDGHIKSADFFDAETYPTMTLVSTGIEQDGSDYVLHTDLTIKGITKAVDWPRRWRIACASSRAAARSRTARRPSC